jgi:hypothetical protein
VSECLSALSFFLSEATSETGSASDRRNLLEPERFLVRGNLEANGGWPFAQPQSQGEISMSNPVASPLERPVAVLSALLLASLLASSAALAEIATPGTHASVIAMSQKPKSDAVSITYAYLPKDGTLNLYALSPSGKMEKTPVGKVALKAGDHRQVSVSLNPMPKKGERLEAVIEQSGQPVVHSGDKAERTFKIL